MTPRRAAATLGLGLAFTGLGCERGAARDLEAVPSAPILGQAQADRLVAEQLAGVPEVIAPDALVEGSVIARSFVAASELVGSLDLRLVRLTLDTAGTFVLRYSAAAPLPGPGLVCLVDVTRSAASAAEPPRAQLVAGACVPGEALLPRCRAGALVAQYGAAVTLTREPDGTARWRAGARTQEDDCP